MENYGQAVLIVGRSGIGKTTSIRNLEHDKTLIIRGGKKNLNLFNWRNLYSDNEYIRGKGLIWSCEDFKELSDVLDRLENTENLPFKNIIFEDFHYYVQDVTFSDEENNRFTQFHNLGVDEAKTLRRIINLAYLKRKNIAILWISNNPTKAEERGTIVFTGSKFIDEKFIVESLFTTVLEVDIIDGKHCFKTNSTDSLRSLKSPIGLFDLYIESDLKYVFDKLIKYDNGIIEESEKKKELKENIKEEKETK